MIIRVPLIGDTFFCPKESSVCLEPSTTELRLCRDKGLQLRELKSASAEDEVVERGGLTIQERWHWLGTQIYHITIIRLILRLHG